ncbi:MAG: hypothetical protein IH598_14245 [Bacteroidales bacterium]|nr:hypothetical protein [Bacteroidales bacterium]
MKKLFYLVFLIAVLLSSCTTPQKVTSYWVNKEAIKNEPYKSIYVFVIIPNESNAPLIENKLADVFVSRGRKVVLNSELYPPSFSGKDQITKDHLVENINWLGCDGVFTVTLLDTKTVETFNQGSSYAPMNYGYYGSYYGYYNYYYPIVYSPSYYSTDKTYYLETNFFDVASDKLVWSIHSEAYNPSDIESMIQNYSKTILNKLREEGLISK